MKSISLFKSFILLLAMGLTFVACDEDVVEDATTTVTFSFTHNFDGADVTASEFNVFDFINANNDTLSISKLRYLVSDFKLFNANGDTVSFAGYNLVDVTNSTGLSFVTTEEVPQGTYTGISFVFGFDSVSNVSNAYADLNVATWNWPDMLGGGYHFMQMEGKYLENDVEMPYAYHNGTAKVSDGVFEQNYFTAVLGGVTLDKANADIEVKMNIAEWYKNPTTWDFSIYNIMLMPNYAAQKIMQANGKSVFSLGTVDQTN
ncbi:MAG: MbnP family protein [Chitinophagales bacterium]